MSEILPTLGLGAFVSAFSSNVSVEPPASPQPVEEIAAANDSEYVFDNANTTHVGEAWFELEDMPADFSDIDTLAFRIRYGRSGAASNNTWDSLSVTVFAANATTQYTDEKLVSPFSPGSGTPVTSTSAALSLFTAGENATKEEWNGALVRIRFAITKNKGGDAVEERVYAAELTGTYTATVPINWTGTVFPQDGSRLPPILVGSTYYACALDTNNLARFGVFSTTTPNTAASWTQVDDDIADGPIGAMAWILQGTTIHIVAKVASGASSGRVHYWSFNTSTGELSAAEDVAIATIGNSGMAVDVAFFNSEPHALYSISVGLGGGTKWRHRATLSGGQWTGSETVLSGSSESAFAGKLVGATDLSAYWTDLVGSTGVVYSIVETFPPYGWGTAEALNAANAGTNLHELTNAVAESGGQEYVAYVRSAGGLGFVGIGVTAETITTSAPLINSETVSASLVMDGNDDAHAVIVLANGSIVIHSRTGVGSWSGSTQLQPASSALIVHAGWVSNKIGYLYDEGAGLIYAEHTPVAGPPEVQASIDLELDIASIGQADHNVAAAVDLELDQTAQAQADHNIVAEIDLELSTTATSSADHDSTASVDLELDMAATVAAPGVGDANVSASIDLELETAATISAAHDVSAAAVDLEIDVAGEVSAPITIPLAQLMDNFDDGVLDTDLWEQIAGTVTEAGGQLELNNATTYAVVRSNSFVDATESEMVAEWTMYTGVATGSAQSGFKLFRGAGATYGHLQIMRTNVDALRIAKTEDNVVIFDEGITYNATNHKWLRVRLTATQTIFEASADGINWTQPWTNSVSALPTWALDDGVKVEMFAGYFNAGQPDPGTTFVDNFNLPPSSESNVSASIDLELDIATASQADHDVSTAIDLELDVSATSQVDHDVSTAIDLELDVSATSQVDHDASAAVDLELDVSATSQVDHDASAAVDLELDVAATTSAPGIANVAASIPLEIDVASTAQIDHDASAAIPLEIDVAPTAQADHDASAAVDLELDVSATSTAPAVGGANVTASIPLVVDIGATIVTDHDVSTSIDLTVDFEPFTAVEHGVVAAIDLILDIQAGSQSSVIPAAIVTGVDITGVAARPTPAITGPSVEDDQTQGPRIRSVVTGPGRKTVAVTGVTGAHTFILVTGAGGKTDPVPTGIRVVRVVAGPRLSRQLTGPEVGPEG